MQKPTVYVCADAVSVVSAITFAASKFNDLIFDFSLMMMMMMMMVMIVIIWINTVVSTMQKACRLLCCAKVNVMLHVTYAVKKMANSL